MDLLVFLVLLGFLSFPYSSFCLVFLASQKTKKHEQPENQETQANNEKQANRENTKKGLVSTPVRGFKDIYYKKVARSLTLADSGIKGMQQRCGSESLWAACSAQVIVAFRPGPGGGGPEIRSMVDV